MIFDFAYVSYPFLFFCFFLQRINCSKLSLKAHHWHTSSQTCCIREWMRIIPILPPRKNAMRLSVKTNITMHFSWNMPRHSHATNPRVVNGSACSLTMPSGRTNWRSMTWNGSTQPWPAPAPKSISSTSRTNSSASAVLIVLFWWILFIFAKMNWLC